MAEDVKVAMKLPAGMSEAEAGKLFQTFLNQRTTGKAREKAIRLATKDLVLAHKAQYDDLVAKYTPNA